MMNLRRLLISILLLGVMPVFANQSKDPEYLEIPGTEGADGGTNIAVQQFIDLMGTQLQGMNIPLQQISQNIPLQQIAGMGVHEKTTQDLLGKFLGTSATQGEAFQAGMGELKKTLGGEFYDPRTSDFWQGYRDVSKMEQEEGVADIRRRGQLGGGLYATPGQRTEADYIKGMGATRTKMLGGLYEKERDRKTSAVSQALGYAGFEEAGKTSRLALGSTIGAIPRGIEDRRSGAAYTQQMGQMKAKNLQYGAEHAQALGQEQSDWATQLAQIGIQSEAAKELMPQWNIDQGGDSGAVGGILGIVSALIGK